MGLWGVSRCGVRRARERVGRWMQGRRSVSGSGRGSVFRIKNVPAPRSHRTKTPAPSVPIHPYKGPLDSIRPADTPHKPFFCPLIVLPRAHQSSSRLHSLLAIIVPYHVLKAAQGHLDSHRRNGVGFWQTSQKPTCSLVCGSKIGGLWFSYVQCLHFHIAGARGRTAAAAVCGRPPGGSIGVGPGGGPGRISTCCGGGGRTCCCCGTGGAKPGPGGRGPPPKGGGRLCPGGGIP